LWLNLPVSKLVMTDITRPASERDNEIYLIYDDDCLLCRQSAKALRLKKAVGQLATINARTDHPLVKEVMKKGYDLNEGIIIKYNDRFYYGTDAIHMLALLSSPVGIFNRLNAFLFKHKLSAKLLYPFFKIIRRLLLIIRRTPKIHMQSEKPIFAAAFGKDWESMPDIFKTRYGNFAFKDQNIIVKGKMNIYVSKYFSFLTPYLQLTGALVPYEGKQIPVTVEFKSKKNSSMVYMNRTFYYPGKQPYSFNSKLLVTKKGDVIEVMRFGIGIRMYYSFADGKVELKYGGYVWKLFRLNLPIPLTLILGKVTAQETMITPEGFSMFIRIDHPILGKIFEYDGIFELAEVS
jgi:predicted DCC family thiol-disulfide oxidoreductase YuxK